MANPYAGGGTAGAALASARGDMGDGNGASRAADLDASSITLGRVVRSLWRYVRPHAVSLVASFVCSAASVLLQLYVPILIGQAIDCMVAAGRVDLVALLPVLHRLAAAVAVAAASQWVAGYCTNRLSSEAVRGADLVLVLDHGRMAGLGTHDELLRDCGLYREICDSQLARGEVA